jgi:hypothetical protein
MLFGNVIDRKALIGHPDVELHFDGGTIETAHKTKVREGKGGGCGSNRFGWRPIHINC